jgi:coenzyme F420-dependent glucose-6-phosphate dehydrogenase
MIKLGYSLSSEEHGPLELIESARGAEAAGFDFALISDHFHPWHSRQPHSPFVWSTLGGIAVSTDKLQVGTGVTCPIQRIHPALVAQAAATTACMMPGRFFLGLGSGENLNEHIFGDRWPPVDIRQEMLEEAIVLIRKLWTGKMTTHYGKHYTVEDARIFTLPDRLPAIAVAASGPRAAEMAGRIGDGLIAVKPDASLVKTFETAGGWGKPRYGHVTVCWAKNEEEARQTAFRCWPQAGLSDPLTTELRSVEHFDQACEDLTPKHIARAVHCGPDPETHLKAIRAYIEAGFDHVYIHQVGPDQSGFVQFYQREILPQLTK